MCEYMAYFVLKWATINQTKMVKNDIQKKMCAKTVDLGLSRVKNGFLDPKYGPKHHKTAKNVPK